MMDKEILENQIQQLRDEVDDWREGLLDDDEFYEQVTDFCNLIEEEFDLRLP